MVTRTEPNAMHNSGQSAGEGLVRVLRKRTQGTEVGHSGGPAPGKELRARPNNKGSPGGHYACFLCKRSGRPSSSLSPLMRQGGQ